MFFWVFLIGGVALGCVDSFECGVLACFVVWVCAGFQVWSFCLLGF